MVLSFAFVGNVRFSELEIMIWFVAFNSFCYTLRDFINKELKRKSTIFWDKAVNIDGHVGVYDGK